MMRMEIGGRAFRLETAAVSALRYRAEYGESVVVAMARPGGLRALEGRLLRMCRMMIPAPERPELEELARLARRDGDFVRKGLRARDALLAGDEAMEKWLSASDGGGDFDEYEIVCALMAAGVDLRLLWELPLLHLAGLAGRYIALRDPDSKTYRKLSREEMRCLYPGAKRRKRQVGDYGKI